MGGTSFQNQIWIPDGGLLYPLGTTQGSGTAYTIPAAQTPANFTLSNRTLVSTVLHATIGANATLNINLLGAKPLYDALGNALGAGSLAVGRRCLWMYDTSLNGGNGAFVLVNPPVTEVFTHQESFSGVVNTTAAAFGLLSSLTQQIDNIQPTDVILVYSDVRYSISDASSFMQIAHYNGTTDSFASVNYSNGITSASGNVSTTTLKSRWTGLTGSITFSVRWRLSAGAGTLYSSAGQMIIEHFKLR